MPSGPIRIASTSFAGSTETRQPRCAHPRPRDPTRIRDHKHSGTTPR
jgi:hypothetical protein